MGDTASTGPQGVDASELVCAARTPGTLGVHDGADPTANMCIGDTPGPNGFGDLSETLACTPELSADRSTDLTSGRLRPESDDVGVVIIDEELLLGAASKGASHAGSLAEAGTIKGALADFGIAQDQFYTKVYKGKQYIIFKGYVGPRQTMTAPRYLVDNTKVLTMSIGRRGLIRSGLRGGILTIALVAAVDVVEHFLNDTATLADLGVTLFVDLTKSVIATAAGTIAGLALVATGSVALPIIAGVAVAIVISELLDFIDEEYEITRTLKRWAEQEISRPLHEAAESTERWWSFLNTPEGIFWLQDALSR